MLVEIAIIPNTKIGLCLRSQVSPGHKSGIKDGSDVTLAFFKKSPTNVGTATLFAILTKATWCNILILRERALFVLL